MKKILTATLFALTAALSANGQGTNDLMRLSRINYSQATARSAAMAGAFTSLGADGMSMSINPAGLAMYNMSEVSITPRIGFNTASSDYSGMNGTSKSSSKFAIGGFSFILDEIAGGNFVLGVGYNRLNDFTSRSEVYGTSEGTSIGQMYMEQLNGIPSSQIGSPSSDPYQAFYKYVPGLWNGIMAYQAGLVNPTQSGDQYNMAGIFNYNLGDTQCPKALRETDGALHEYTLSGAYNFKKKLYIGLTVGLQNMIYNEEYRYSEVTDLGNSGSLDNFTLKQRTEQNGIGVNVKVGATLNLDWFRIGLAYHSPTWGNFKDNSYSSLTVYDKTMSGYGFSDTPILSSTYQYTSPSHLLAGVSATIAKTVLVAADYEMVGYGSMKYRNDIFITGYRAPVDAGAIDNLQNASLYSNGSSIDVNSMVKDYYKTAHNFRFAVEVRPIKQLYLRAGYAYYGSMYKDSELDEYGRMMQYSGGVGLRFGRFVLDVAYVYGQQKQLPSRFFRYVADDGYTVQSSGISNTTFKNSTVLVTLALKTF